MQIVDREGAWPGKEGGPEGRRKRLAEGVAVVMAAAGFFFLAHLLNGKGAAFGEPYLVKLGSVEVEPGKTTIQDLADAGYGFSDLSRRKAVQDAEDLSFIYQDLYDLSQKADGNTIYTSITLVKDGQCVALVSAVNEQDTQIPLAECKIGGITIYPDYYESGSVTLEGLDFSQLSAETLTEMLGKPEKVSDSGDSYRWERGAYHVRLEYKEDGTLESFDSRFKNF